MAELKQSRNPWSFGRKGWGVAFAGIACWYFWQGPLYAGSNFWFTGLNEMFGWEVTSMAAALTIGGVASVFTTALFGGLVKKFGAVKIIFIGFILAALVDLIFAFAQTLWAYQVSAAIYFAICMSYSAIGVGQLGADWFPRKRGVYMGIATVGMTATTATTPLLLSIFVPQFGIMATLLFHSALQIVIGFIIFALVKNNPEDAGAYPDNDKSVSKEALMKEFQEMEEYRKNSPWTTSALLREPATWKIGIGWGLSMMVIVGTVQQLVNILISFGHDLTFGVTLMAVTWPVGVFGHALTGAIDYKIGPRWTSALALIIAIIGSALLNVVGTSPVGAGAAGGLFLVGATMITVECPSMTTAAFGRRDFMNAWPVVSTIYQLLTNVGVLVIAVIAAAVGYSMDLWIMCGLMAIVIIIMLSAPKEQVTAPQLKAQP
ncbi:MAG: MFS transporter [Clostridiales Family XIII bacterium]|jgi:sugar phosphate permease|nr:MFS transporter [Clostridiales Family XIII bacterium]